MLSQSGGRQHHHATIVTALAVAALYLWTLAPSVVGGDAGELIAATATGGVPHPPGYPLYALLGKLFLMIPFGEPALRMNLFSLVCGVAAAVILQRAAARWSGSPWAGTLAAACFAFSPVVWEHSVGAEVFALHHVFVAALLWVAVLYAESCNEKWVWTGAAVAALGMSHHHTIIFFVFPLALWALIRQPQIWLKPWRLAVLAGIGLAGLLPYAWLPFATASGAAVSWGDWTTIEGAWKHFTRAEYGTLQLASGEVASNGGFGARLVAWFMFQSHAIGWIGWLVVAMGLVCAWRCPKSRAMALCTTGMLVFYLMVFNHLANLSPADPLMRSVLVRFWTAPHLIVCLWLAWGWVVLTKSKPNLHVTGVVVLSILPVLVNLPAANRRGAREFSNYGEAWLAPLPQGAVLLARGDLIVNTVHYRQHCTGFRRDVRVLDLERMTYEWQTKALKQQQPDLILPGSHYQSTGSGGYQLKPLIDANPQLGPWFVAGDLNAAEKAGLPGWTILPHGLGWQLVPPGNPLNFESWWKQSEAALPRFTEPADSRRKVDSWSAAVTADMIEARNRRGVTALEIAAASGNPPNILRHAVAVFEAESQLPGAPARVHKNLGIAWQRLEGRDPNATANAAAAWKRFLELEDGTDRDVIAIQHWLNQR